ncbi:hypothetical protein ASA1KI_04180 [Opitutales bacterium ASA1]|uniref:hypothetical protein n=1 Tax=Congregicoccus parvus TaxID=3081749 RepID=UPI002B29C590|nr:hypothetical protein ASA1KI_04180 [Opitutales bacterium ASA1]
MICRRTFRGLEAEIRPTGRGRFGTAAFLFVWLVFWLAGEAFASAILVAGGWALITGEPLSPGQPVPELSAAIAVGGFLLVWLTFWTFGGIVAIREFEWLVAGRVGLVATADGLLVEKGRRPFMRSRFHARSDLLALHGVPIGGALAAITKTGVIELARFDSHERRSEVAAELCAELSLPFERPPTTVLPEGWCEVAIAEGGTALVQDPDVRTRLARIAGCLCLVASAGAASLWFETREHPGLVVPATIVSLVAGGMAWGTARLSWTRAEWRIREGRAALHRRVRRNARKVFECSELRMLERSDSDGDTHYELIGVAPDHAADGSVGKRGTTRRIVSVLHDPITPRMLGRWLAAKTGMPFFDLDSEQGDALGRRI